MRTSRKALKGGWEAIPEHGKVFYPRDATMSTGKGWIPKNNAEREMQRGFDYANLRLANYIQ